MDVHASLNTLPELQTFLGNFRVRFRRPEAKDALERYTTSLLTELPNKNCDTLAKAVPGSNQQRLQGFLLNTPSSQRVGDGGVLISRLTGSSFTFRAAEVGRSITVNLNSGLNLKLDVDHVVRATSIWDNDDLNVEFAIKVNGDTLAIGGVQDFSGNIIGNRNIKIAGFVTEVEWNLRIQNNTGISNEEARAFADTINMTASPPGGQVTISGNAP